MAGKINYDNLQQLTLIEGSKHYIKSKNSDKNILFYNYNCSCGIENLSKRPSDVKSLRVRSCGCLNSKVSKERMTSHGESYERLHVTWNNMKSRCYKKSNNEFKNYGARGIIVCEDWKNSYLTFSKWARSNGYTDELTIDRINVNGNYCPENCRFLNYVLQAQNTRTSIGIEKARLIRKNFNLGMLRSELAIKYNINWSTVDRIISNKSYREEDQL